MANEKSELRSVIEQESGSVNISESGIVSVIFVSVRAGIDEAGAKLNV